MLYEGPHGHQVSAVFLLLITSASGNLTLPFSAARLLVLLKYYLFVNSLLCNEDIAAPKHKQPNTRTVCLRCVLHQNVFFFTHMLSSVFLFCFFIHEISGYSIKSVVLLPANQPIFLLAKVDVRGVK